METKKLTWIPFYTKFADILLTYKNNRKELLDKLVKVHEECELKFPKLEEDGSIIDIDPFSVYAMFNKYLTDSNRKSIIKGISEEFDVHCELPEDFEGIPLVNNQGANFFGFKKDRKDNDIQNLWELFDYAIRYSFSSNINNEDIFNEYYNRAIKQYGVKWNITMGLFWIRPEFYLNLDTNNRNFIISKKLLSDSTLAKAKYLKNVPNGSQYLEICKEVELKMEYSSFAVLSDAAYYFDYNNANKMEIDGNLYWPSLEYYNPGLTKEDWIKYLTEVEIPDYPRPMEMLKAMLELGGEASPKKLSTIYGGIPQGYVGSAVALGKRVKKYFSLPTCMDVSAERYFPVAFFGRAGDQEGENYYNYRIRPELKEALKEVDLSKFDAYYHKNVVETSPTSLPESEIVVDSEVNYWWLNANPKIWSFSNINVGNVQGYTLYNENGNKRRVFSNFLEVKPGDKIIGYESNPVKQVVALCEITKENDGESIYFKKNEGLATPIDYATLKEFKELEEMEYFASPQGSLFKLTKDEYDFIMDLVRESNPVTESKESLPKFTKENFLNEVYMTEDNYTMLSSLLKRKKNIILQGAPGVGKTFAAKKLAYSIMGVEDKNRLQEVQFHQNYSYEDFIMGYKPEDDSFKLKYGIFYQFCQKAANDPKHDYFFIIDEINRGNMSKIFGELLMLIENDYRGKSITLAYSGTQFSVPENLYIIGMMNTADRSLAMIDYALRRRFSFFEMKPGFDSKGFKEYQKSLHNDRFNNLIEQVVKLNNIIKEDDSLGAGFMIGHSYFCNCNPDNCTDDWMKAIVEYDLIPTLKEYWFDNKKQLDTWTKNLRDVFND